MEKITGITNEELETFRRNFSRCVDCDVVSLKSIIKRELLAKVDILFNIPKQHLVAKKFIPLGKRPGRS